MAGDLMTGTIRLKIPSQTGMIKVARNCAGVIAERMNFPGEQVEEIKLSLNEALANVIKHAYKGDQSREIDIRFNVDGRVLEIRIRDYGEKVDLDRIKSRELDKVRPHGLGVFLMKELMDEVRYDTSPEVGTELIMVKYIPEKGG